MNKTAAAATPTTDSAIALEILDRDATPARPRVWGPLAEVKRWWALAGADIVRDESRGSGLLDGEESKVDSWFCYVDGRIAGYIDSLVELQVKVPTGWTGKRYDANGNPTQVPSWASEITRGRMAYSFIATL